MAKKYTRRLAGCRRGVLDNVYRTMVFNWQGQDKSLVWDKPTNRKERQK